MFLKGNHISLRGLEPKDVNLLYLWENDPEVWQMSQTLKPYSHFTLKMFVECANDDLYRTKQVRLMVDDIHTRETIGIIDIFDFDPYNSRAGIGILIERNHRRNGIGTEAIQLTQHYLFDVLKIHQVYCNILVDNEASIKLFTNNNFTLIGTKKEWTKVDNGYKDVLLFQCINPNPRY